ncbi:glycosyltransferase [Salinibacterium sp. GXW1014]|uniref:glycosyltransferase n=1 Tax=Salinibacterium sp. GXW1014 TaxID=3377838 RepID=UPI00383A1A48
MTSTRARVLVLTYTPIAREPRALKQINHLAERFEVTSAGFGEAPVDGVEHLELESSPRARGIAALPGLYTLLLAFRIYPLLQRWNSRNQAALRRLAGREWDVIIAHDVHTLWLANQLRPRRGILVDLHEYAPRQNEHSFLWRLLIGPYFRWICRHQVTKASAVTTVGQGIVDEYRREFGFNASLVVNATPFQPLSPVPTAHPIRLVHSGIPGRARKLEIMIEAVRSTTADVTLDLFLIKDGSEYYDELVELAGDSDRIRFMDPVPYADLVTTLNGYDLGLSVIAPTTFNLTWCLPNKFFDFVQARLGVIIGPSAEMVSFVERYEIGAVADDFTAQSLGRLLETITPAQIEAWKSNSDRYARELSSEEQVKIWGRIVEDIVSSR